MADPDSQVAADALAAFRGLDREELVLALVAALAQNDSLRAEVLALTEKVRGLESRLNTHSGNSSIPPSADPPKSKAEQKKARQEKRRARRKGPKRGRGGQPGHAGRFRKRVSKEGVSETRVLVPPECPHCSAPLDAGCAVGEKETPWHQVHELATRLIDVIEYLRPLCKCPGCGGRSRAELPPEVGRSVLGPRLTALSLFLRGQLQSSERDVVELFSTVLDTKISLGTVSNCEAKLTEALSQPYQEVLDAISGAKFVNVDETTWYQQSNYMVLWVATNDELAAYQIDPSKGREAFHRLLGVEFKGIIGSDRAKTYDSIPPARRQICWGHLDRNFQKLYDAGGEGSHIAKRVTETIDELFHIWHKVADGKLAHHDLARALRDVQDRFGGLLNEGLLPSVPDMNGICVALAHLWDGLWTFTKIEDVEPTNNAAERAARPAVTLRKTSLGSQSERGSRFIERMMTAIQTLRKQGRSTYAYLVSAIKAYFIGKPAPSLLPQASAPG